MKKTILTFIFGAFVMTTYSQSSVGLVAHWDMNGTVNDISGNGFNGHAHNVTPVAGMVGVPNTAYYFNGVNSYISAPYGAALNVSKYTICATVKIMGFYSGDCQGNCIFTRGSGAGHTPGSYCLYFDDNQFDSSCSNFDSTEDVFYGGAPLTPPYYAESYYSPTIQENIWYKVVVTFNDTMFNTYVNGILKASYRVSGAGTSIGTSLDSVCIGYNLYDAVSFPYQFHGIIDDIRFYNRALADSEVLQYGDTCGRITLQPASSSTIVGSNATYSVSVSISSPSYQWQQDAGLGFVSLSNSGPYSGVRTSILTITDVTAPMNNDRYRCIVSNSGGCVDTSRSAVLTAVTSGVNNIIADNSVSVYPNPLYSDVSIQIKNNFNDGRFQVINQLGQIISEKSLNGSITKADLNNIPTGVYILKIVADDQVFYEKISKY